MVPFARPACEALEGRALLSGGLPGQPLAPAALLVSDVNSDGSDDLFLAWPDGQQVLLDRDGTGWAALAGWQHGMRGPTALALADVTGDRLADLIVANSSGTGVVVFPGLGGGQFGPELFGGKGVETGPLPGGFAVASLGEEGKADAGGADLVVTRPAANEVVVLLSSGNPEAGLQVGQRLGTAAGPVAVLVADATGDGIADLLVTCRESDRVWVLAGLGNGRFDTSPFQEFHTGDRPVRSVFADFDGNGRPDLISLDSGSHTLTFFRDVGSRNTAAETLPSGGRGPVDALVRDVNGDGVSDVMVANRDDGQVALFLGGEQGLQLTQTLSLDDMRPTALAASATDPDPWAFYAAGEGSTSVTHLRFNPLLPAHGFESADGPREPGPTVAQPEEDSAAIIDLKPLGPSLADVVPVVLSTSDGQGEPEPGTAGPAPREAVPGRLPRELSGGSPGMEAGPAEVPAAMAIEDVELHPYLLGLDEVAAPWIEADGTVGEREEEMAPLAVWPAEAAAAPPRQPSPFGLVACAPSGGGEQGSSSWWRDDLLVQALWVATAVRLAWQGRLAAAANDERGGSFGRRRTESGG